MLAAGAARLVLIMNLFWNCSFQVWTDHESYPHILLLPSIITIDTKTQAIAPALRPFDTVLIP